MDWIWEPLAIRLKLIIHNKKKILSDFFLKNWGLITHFVEISAATTGLIYFKKYKDSHVRFFIYFLIYVVFIEIFGSYARYIDKFAFLEFLKNTPLKASHWCSTIFWNIGSAVFFSFYYHRILKNRIFRTIVKYLCIIFLISAISSIAFNWDIFFAYFSPFITVFGAMVILTCISFYLIEILQNETFVDFYKSIDFIISAIIFIWLIITTPIVLYTVYYSTSDWNFVILRWQIFLFANIFMYLSFALSFIYCKSEHD